MERWVTWRTAMQQALYGEGGFYRRGEPAAAHYRTSVHASPRYADALGRLLVAVDEALGGPARLDVVDVGAGCGGLLGRILEGAPAALAGRLNPVAVEIAPRPESLPERITWRDTPPEEITGLVVANEWLDNVPLDVIELTPEGPRTVLVDIVTGAERPGPEPTEEDLTWLDRWWPLKELGDRAEIGRPRCTAWASVLQRLSAGLALAVDYAHARDDRPAYGTLTGYRDGRTVPPVPDGSCDITAHVALDACAAASSATATTLITQRRALRALGLTGTRPPLHLAHRDPHAYITALCRAGEDAELTHPEGLGTFGWLAQTSGIALPSVLISRDQKYPA